MTDLFSDIDVQSYFHKLNKYTSKKINKSGIETAKNKSAQNKSVTKSTASVNKKITFIFWESIKHF